MVRYIAIILLAGGLGPLPLVGETMRWNWLSAKFTPCEGIGVHGSYRVYVSAEVESVDQQRKKIRSLAVYAGSAALQQNRGDLAGKISIEKDGAILASAKLVRQASNSIAEAPKADETQRIFLPLEKTLDVPRGSKVVVEVSLSVKTDSGSCSLGSSSNNRDLFK